MALHPEDNTMTPHQHWIVTADSRGAALFSCQRTPGGELHVEEARSLQNGHEHEQDRHRPALLGGAERRGAAGRSGGHAAPHSVAPHHAAEEDQHRYARDVGEWLGRANWELGIAGSGGRLSVFAPPKLLSLLRDRMAGLGAAAEFHEGELSQLSSAELAAHPAVRHALERPAAT